MRRTTTSPIASILTVIVLGSLSGCATMMDRDGSDEDWNRVCRPGHAVRFAVPEHQPVPPDYRAPEQGSCMR